MKRKLPPREQASPEQSADYIVGQVSGSLVKKNSAASGSLAALFSTAAPAASRLFQPAPQPVRTTTEEKQQQNDTPEVRGQPRPKKEKKQPKEKSAADQILENRESGLQKADEDEGGRQTSVRSKTRKRASESGQHNHVEYWVMKRQRLKASKEEEALKRKRTVFVGNLPISCTKKMLRSLFRDTGSIESIRFRSLIREDPSMSLKVAAIKRKLHPKKKNINAYVVFKDDEGVVKALERNGTEIETDFHIRVDRVIDSSSHDHKRSVFVGNLSFEISELDFRRHFDQCGSVEAVRLVRDQSSGLGKGFGYVLFESADSVQLALELDGSKLEGRSIRVKRSVKKEKQKNKTTGRTGRGPTKTPTKRPVKGSGREGEAGRGNFKSVKKFSRKQQVSTKRSTSFRGEEVDPNKHKKKGLKKKVKRNKAHHI